MGNQEHEDGDWGEYELRRSNHFYAAYVFDQVETHQKDITMVIEETHRLGYPMRYWWLSQAMDIQDFPDRLILCADHPKKDENAGMDLYDALHARQVSYDELDSAAPEEYVYLGKRVDNLDSICLPDGLPLFRQSNSLET